MSRYLTDPTQPEVAAQLKRDPLVILPAGSVEQHGPHLPFRLLDEAQGGTAEIKRLKVAG